MGSHPYGPCPALVPLESSGARPVRLARSKSAGSASRLQARWAAPGALTINAGTEVVRPEAEHEPPTTTAPDPAAVSAVERRQPAALGTVTRTTSSA